MATLLAHIRVRPGMEARFEQLATELFQATHANERAVRRYEYFRGTDPGTYYASAVVRRLSRLPRAPVERPPRDGRSPTR